MPYASPVDVLADALVAHSDGSARYIHEIEIADFGGDLKLDVFLAIRDESYSGVPVFDFLYFEGAEDGWCGLPIASGLAALNDDVYIEFSASKETQGPPQLTFSFTEADLATNTTDRKTFVYTYDEAQRVFVAETTSKQLQ